MAEEEGYKSYAQENPSGSWGSIVQAGKDTPVLGSVISGVQDASKGDIGALGADIGSFAMGALAVAEDPLNALISAGLGWLADVVYPIRECLEKVTGNPEALDGGKEAFEDIGKDIENLSTELDQITKIGFANWTGDAKEAASQKVETFVQGVEGTAGQCDDVAQLLGLSSTLMEAAYNIIMGILASCIEWLIVTWIAALAAEIPTCGGSTAAAGAATTAEVGVEGANAADKVEEATSLVERITSIFQKIISKLKGLLGKDGEEAAEGAENAAGKAGAEAGEDAGASTSESAAESTESSAGDSTGDSTGSDTGPDTTSEPSDSSGGGDDPSGDNPSGNGPSGDGSGNGGDGNGGSGNGEGGSGEGGSGNGSNNENKSWLQKKWDETQENWNKNVNPTAEQANENANKSLGTWLTEHETSESGTTEPNRVEDVLLDAGKDVGLKLSGNLLDSAISGDSQRPSQSDQQIDNELQG